MSRSQQVILQAVEDEVMNLIDSGELDESVLHGLPESHAFTPEPGEPWDEDDAAAIRLVGERDMAAKIEFFRRILDQQ